MVCVKTTELLFRELKTHFSLDKIPTANPNAVKAMLWTAILTLVVHRIVFLTICELQPEKAPYMSHERSSIAFRDGGATLILGEALERRGLAYGLAESMTFVSCGAFNLYREHSIHMKEWRA